MNTDPSTSRENLTLSEADLAACKPIAGEGGHVLRALCPFHGSDHQHSLRVTVATGRFVCFACGAWGYLAEARERWQEERQRQTVACCPRTLSAWRGRHSRRSGRRRETQQTYRDSRTGRCVPRGVAQNSRLMQKREVCHFQK
jgi:hypothetical protein